LIPPEISTRQLGSIIVYRMCVRTRHGRGHAETALYQKYSAKVYYLALRESKSAPDAEDVRAETFLRVLQAIHGQPRSPEVGFWKT